MSSLRDQIQLILDTGAMTYDTSHKQVLFSSSTHVDAILKALQTAVLAAAPKKIAKEYPVTKEFGMGWDSAIDQYTKALQQLFERNK